PITRLWAMATIRDKRPSRAPRPVSSLVTACLDCYRSFDRRMRIVSFQREVFVPEGKQIAHIRVEPHQWQPPRFAFELLARLLEMVEIQMRVSEGVHELTWLQSAHLRDHQRKQCVRGDVERDAEEQIGAALVELAGEPAAGHVELKKRMAGRQLHLWDVRDVPRRNQ